MNKRILEMLVRAKNSTGPGIREAKRSLRGLKGAVDRVNKGFLAFSRAAVAAIAKVKVAVIGLIAVFAGLAIGIKKAIDTAGTFQKLKLQLSSFTKSAEETEAVFKRIVQFAATTPFDVEGVVQAAAILKPLEQMGFKLEELLQASGNLAASFNIDLSLAALQLSKSFSAGIGAAELLRDRGVRAFIEIKEGIDLTKVPLEELRTILLKTFTDGSTGIGSGMARTAATFTGKSANMADAIKNFSAAIGEAIITNGSFLRLLDVITRGFERMTAWVVKNKDEIGLYVKIVSQGLITSLKNAWAVMKNVIQAFKTLAKWMFIMKDGVMGITSNMKAWEKELQKVEAETVKNTGALKDMSKAIDEVPEGLKKVKNEFKEVEKAGKAFASATESAISDTLFNAITDKSKTFFEHMKDAWEQFKRSVIRIVTDMVAEILVQQAKIQLMKMIGSGGGGGGGGFAQGLSALFGGGGATSPAAAAGGHGLPGAGAGGSLQQLATTAGSLNSRLLATQNITAKGAQVTAQASKATAQAGQAMQATSGAAGQAAQGMLSMGQVGMAVGVGLAGAFLGGQLGNAIKKGGLAGQNGRFGTAGALAGGIIGTMILPGVGTIIGAGLGGLVGGLFHTGGKIPRRADIGMTNRANDQLIMAQTGEGVITRQGMRTLGDAGLKRLNEGQPIASGQGGDTWNVHIVAVDSKSFAEQLARNPEAVLKVVQKGIKKNAGIRRDIKEFAT